MEVDLVSFKHIVLDEADKYFEMSFMDQLGLILESLRSSQRHYYLFSATFPTEIEEKLSEIFVDPIEVVIKGKLTVLNTIAQELCFTGDEFGKLVQLKNIINVTFSPFNFYHLYLLTF